MPGKRILITGAAGFIGSSLTDRLLQNNYSVCGVDNFNRQYNPQIKRDNLAKALDHPKFKLIKADICNLPCMQEILHTEHPDITVHLAARVGIRTSFSNPRLYYLNNIQGTHNLLEACRLVKHSHIVLASSAAVYSKGNGPLCEEHPTDHLLSPYAVSKRSSELLSHMYHQLHNMKITVLRIFTVYGPRQRPEMAVSAFTKAADQDKTVSLFGGEFASRDFTYIDDCVRGILKAIERPLNYEIINIGSQVKSSLKELLKLISKCLNKPVRAIKLPLNHGDVEESLADIQKAREKLDYEPRFSLDEGIKTFIEWYQAQKKMQIKSPTGIRKWNDS